MEPQHKRTAGALVRAVVMLAIKLLLNAARDIVLIPLAVAAAVADLALLRSGEPRFFRAVLRMGEWSDRWIDVWSGGREPHEDPRENVDALLARVEVVVRDPQAGARRARVLRRWAERQLTRARRAARPALGGDGTERPPGGAKPKA
ncbi:hypothetical protein [Dokdonella fugitiva]|jgi:hypothetical protein|uniref:hypothetical protein n=1 Tax=Dokdonella fugitiva TaxID=328517 RepID=UPI0015FE72D3|nr:hypothetical protein [Dokdonella fugitiva]MBA8883429.1 hypothetical protein [Dokdonella fugitiva]